MRNPYIVPRLEDDPDQPLCPWRDGSQHHEEYYADVGGHLEEFELFKQKLRHPDTLTRAGRIVVVSGPDLSGKTSLANRCVRWVQAGLAPETAQAERSPKTQCFVYALREVSPRRATVEDRVARVCRRLIDRLREFDTGSGEGLSGRLNAQDVLPLFGNFHQSSTEAAKRFFIILLPGLEPDTAGDEIDEYRAALADVPGVLCVTENPDEARLPEHRGETTPISLHLRHMHPGESRKLVAGWPNSPKQGDNLRVIRETDLDELERLLGAMNANLTLGKLLTVLRKIYNNPLDIGDHQAGQVPYVEFAELARAYLGKWFRQNAPQGSA